MRTPLLFCLLCSWMVSAASAGALPDYIRFAEDSRSARLETAIRSFTLPSGQKVDLVGTVHIADPGYYQQLNERFKAYDAVLFELVGDPRALTQARVQSDGGGISSIQQSVARYLKLSFQLGAIDYSPKNMIHADATLAEFAQMQQERGENMLTLFVRAMNAQMSSGASQAAMRELDTFGLIRILMSPDSAAEFKKALAKVFDQSEAMTASMEGQDGSVVLSGRNAVAHAKLVAVLANRKMRRIAVFYGGAHMPGMEATLVKELNAKVSGEDWLAAWTMEKNGDIPRLPAERTKGDAPAAGTSPFASK
jgi:hypothetical protein